MAKKSTATKEPPQVKFDGKWFWVKSKRFETRLKASNYLATVTDTGTSSAVTETNENTNLNND
jgi:hypothetical protein